MEAAARPATLVAKARTLAKAREAAPPTEANHLKHSDETAVVVRGAGVFKLPPSYSAPKADVHFS
jgi:hypothetical protein